MVDVVWIWEGYIFFIDVNGRNKESRFCVLCYEVIMFVYFDVYYVLRIFLFYIVFDVGVYLDGYKGLLLCYLFSIKIFIFWYNCFIFLKCI